MAARANITHATPGPWHVGEGGAAMIIYDQNGYAVADAKTFHGKHAAYSAHDNARLIAAAPDLLAALNLAYEALGEERGFHQSTTAIKIRAAIAKAEGR